MNKGCLFWISLFTLIFSGPNSESSNCFERTFCATGTARRFVLCSRGADCSKALDHGMAFKSDCTVSRWLGDALETRPYEIQGSTVLVKPRLSGDADTETYSLDLRRGTLKSKGPEPLIWKVSACSQETKNKSVQRH